MADPIFWANQEIARANRILPARRFNEETGVLEPVIDPVTRQPLMERVPQRGHAGDSDPKSPRIETRIRRWMHVLRHDGIEARVPITTAAAPVEDSNYGAWMGMKARHFGWIPIGQCPLALLLTGAIRVHHLVAVELQGEQACPHGTYGEQKACPHYLVERRARRALKAELQRRRDVETETMEQKALKAQQATAEGILELGRQLMGRPPEAPAAPAAPAQAAPDKEPEGPPPRRK